MSGTFNTFLEPCRKRMSEDDAILETVIGKGKLAFVNDKLFDEK